ncbi:MAG: hypothetical protein BWY82_02354 [Verrucomicrobia bacterium ADurb.Bin474]|nr:MAG: hypothetical protein BWY82_02354 [Verrucomicrobia bacterium ADurb.Bin474]
MLEASLIASSIKPIAELHRMKISNRENSLFPFRDESGAPLSMSDRETHTIGKCQKLLYAHGCFTQF